MTVFDGSDPALPNEDLLEDLRKNHGTPAEFLRALWAAQADGFITVVELKKADAEYRREWAEASRRT